MSRDPSQSSAGEGGGGGEGGDAGETSASASAPANDELRGGRPTKKAGDGPPREADELDPVADWDELTLPPRDAESDGAWQHVYENGRRYHWYQQGRYPLPNDEEEQDREDMKHAMMLELTVRGGPRAGSPFVVAVLTVVAGWKALLCAHRRQPRAHHRHRDRNWYESPKSNLSGRGGFF